MTSCHFLPRVVSFQSGVSLWLSWNNCDRWWVRQVERNENGHEPIHIVRSPYFVDYFVPDTTKFVALCRAALFRYARSYEALSGK